MRTYCTEIWAAVEKAKERIQNQLIKERRLHDMTSQLWIIDWDKRTLDLETIIDGHVLTETCQLKIK